MNQISSLISVLETIEIEPNRRQELDLIAKQLLTILNKDGHLNMNFVCTHNSRRSQLAQVWSYILAEELELPIKSYSSGTEVTACNERTIGALERNGLQFNLIENGSNPFYEMKYGNANAIRLFSKTVNDHSVLPSNFIAMMTCDHADANCPFIPEAIARIPFRFTDPKSFDDTDQEENAYNAKSLEIGSQLQYIYKQLA